MEKCCHLKGEEKKIKLTSNFPRVKPPTQKSVQKCLKVLGETKLRPVDFDYVMSPPDRKY